MGLPAADERGRPFGRYRLVERIGIGGMAVVYRAVAEGPEGFTRSLVIKRVLPEHGRDPSFARMLVAEARLSALLHHPGIVQVFELGQVGDEYYLAMEHVEGIDLVTLLNRCARLGRPVPIGIACYIASEVAAALAYAHDLRDEAGQPIGIVHRDVSPSNVMVTPTGAVKLLDFGIALAGDRVRDERTRTGRLKGKISYLSPEQADGLPIDRRADVFALGIVLYECLTMQRLFRGDDDLRSLKLVREAKVAPPSTIAPAIDGDLDAVVMKMLARDPAARFARCDEVVTALAPIIHRIEVGAASLQRFLAEIGPFEHEGRPVDDCPDVERPPPRRPPFAWAAAGAIALALVATPIAWLASRSGPRTPIPVPTAAAAPAALVRPPPDPARIPVRSEPPGARILVDGQPRGTTPAVVPMALPSEVLLTLDGYRPVREVVSAAGELHVRLPRIARPKTSPPARSRHEHKKPRKNR